MASAWRALPVAVVLALSSAGCGDSGVTTKDFAAAADAVCREGNAAARALAAPTDLPTIKDITAKLGGIAAKTAERLAELETPSGDAGDAAEDLVNSMGDAGEAAKRVGPEVDAGNFPGIESEVNITAEALGTAGERAKGLGSAECAKGEAEAIAKVTAMSGQAVKAAYIAKADALCAVANKVYDAQGKRAPRTIGEVKARLDTIVNVHGKLVADLKAIPQPMTDKDKLDKLFALNDEFVAKAKAVQYGAAQGSGAMTVDALEHIRPTERAVFAAGRAYGFKDCGT